MILSEFAGAAQSLNGSIVVNPWDSQQVADAIHEAVTMDAATRAENHRKLFKYVNKYSAAYWGTSFIKEMGRLDVKADKKEQEKEKQGEEGKQGVLEVKRDDPASANGTVLVNGEVPVTPLEM
jgi:trehalose 6-phosphate synthase